MSGPLPRSPREQSVPPAPRGEFEVLVWDLDGTLIDSKHDLAEAIRGLLAEYGYGPLSDDSVAAHVGKGARNLVARCLEEHGHRLPDAAALESALRAFERHYVAHLLDHTRLYPGLDTLLPALHARGQRMAIATNKPEHFSLRIVEGLGARDWFSAIVGTESSVPERKPHPAMVFEAMRRASPGAEPSRCLLIGDSAIDVEAGRRAEMPVCGVAWGLGPEGEVFTAGPEFGARTVEELAEALLGV